MSKLVLDDFGGQFITSEPVDLNGENFPGISAYVQWFIPANSKDVSVTFVHGGGGQGAEFITTSDGRPGWAHCFLRAGYPVYILDRPGHGRNHWNEKVLGPALPQQSYESLIPRFAEAALHDLWPEAKKHTRWPKAITAKDRFMASQGPLATELEQSQRHVEAIGTALFEITGQTILLSHSAGGPCGWALSAIAGDRVKAIVACEPLGYPGQQHALGTFKNGLAAADFDGKHDPYNCPIAVLTADASWFRESNALAVEYLREKKKAVEHIQLWEHGITGNGHMMMSETNSDEIAELILAWIEKVGRDK